MPCPHQTFEQPAISHQWNILCIWTCSINVIGKGAPQWQWSCGIMNPPSWKEEVSPENFCLSLGSNPFCLLPSDDQITMVMPNPGGGVWPPGTVHTYRQLIGQWRAEHETAARRKPDWRLGAMAELTRRPKDLAKGEINNQNSITLRSKVERSDER